MVYDWLQFTMCSANLSFSGSPVCPTWNLSHEFQWHLFFTDSLNLSKFSAVFVLCIWLRSELVLKAVYGPPPPPPLLLHTKDVKEKIYQTTLNLKTVWFEVYSQLMNCTFLKIWAKISGYKIHLRTSKKCQELLSWY